MRDRKGLAVNRSRLFVDIETYSATPIEAGPYRYSEDPDFEILMAAWSWGDGEVLVAQGEDNVLNIPGLFNPKVIKVAHNANFERICFSHLRGYPVGSYLDPEEYHCTQAVAGEHGYPQKLERLAPALGAEEKDSAGTALIRLFCIPNRGRRVYSYEHPEKWRQFIEYCRQDVATLVDVDRRLVDHPTEMERRIWFVDQRINDRGMKIDRKMAENAVAAAEDNQMAQELEFTSLTGVANPGSVQQVGNWIRGRGYKIPNLRAETVDGLLQRDGLEPTVRRALEIRQELALVASKKFGTALDYASSDDRLRGGYRFFGAHTGRWAGRGVQPHNLPRAQLNSDAETLAAILDLELGLGGSAYTLKALVRAMFVGPLTVVDYSAIEARVIAWWAGEQWALDAFKAGRDIYVETAQRMGGLTRSQGKVAVLALGYNGGIESLRHMGAKGDDPALQYLVTQWRRANPAIVNAWKSLDTAFRVGGPVGDFLEVEKDGHDRRIILPSGRHIAYHDVKFVMEMTPAGPRPRASFTDPRRGIRISTYGGRLAENVTQAIARDIMGEALVRLDDEGYDVIGHVHDEIIVEGKHPVDLISAIMCEQPSWATGLPIDGAGFNCLRYRKDYD